MGLIETETPSEKEKEEGDSAVKVAV